MARFILRRLVLALITLAIILVIVTLIGGTLAAGGANAVNMYVDRDIDALMERTQNRPLVVGIIAPRNALIFAMTLLALSFAVLWAGANLLAACLAIGAAAFYIGIYTLWLKRTSRQNIVIGGAAGAMPVLVGWAAVTNTVSWEPVVLFVAMFLWTPPHSWALAVKYADDYSAADVPMLPSVAPMEHVVSQMKLYTAGLVVATLVLWPVASLGFVYGVTAVVLGAMFLWGTYALGKNPSPGASMRLFGFSITYVTVLFGAMMLDVFLEHGVSAG